ncbi:MAG: hypothetical protein U9N45_08240, partial [Gemmatimonadota bacterium]|nr:hypothetical protein [Gemmatimonadota bacterium]
MPEKPQAMTGRRRIHAAFRHEAVDRVPIFDQSISSGLASKVMGREMLLGGGELRFREVEARFESPHAGAEFEERMIGDVATFYKTMGYDMFRLPWRDTRKASRRLDEKTYLFGTDDNSGKEAPWEIYRFSAESDNWHQMDSWLAGGNVDRLFGWLKKENSLWQGPDRDPSRFDSLRRFKSLLGDDTALAVTVASLMVPMWETAWLMALEIEPELVAGELDRQVEQGLADLEEVAVIGVDVIHAGGDFCLNSGPV